MLPWVCSVIDHRGRQNVVKTTVTHSPAARVPLLCFYGILTSSVIYYWTDPGQHGIYLLTITVKSRGVARLFQRGGHRVMLSRDTIRGSPTIYGLYRCSPSCISVLSRIIAAWRPILTRAVDENALQKTNFKEVGFSTMAFTAKILSCRFRHLNIVGCLLKRRPTKGGSRAPQDPPPLATPLKSVGRNTKEKETLLARYWHCY